MIKTFFFRFKQIKQQLSARFYNNVTGVIFLERLFHHLPITYTYMKYMFPFKSTIHHFELDNILSL